MRVEPFDPKLFIGATVHTKQGRFQSFLNGEIPRFNGSGTTWAGLFGDDLVCIGGMVQSPEAANEIAAWLLFTDRITPGRFVAVYREAMRMLTALLRTGTRVVIHVDPQYPEAVRMAAKLRFRESGEIQFYDGRTMIRMVADV